MTTEYWMKFFLYTSVIWSSEKVGGFLKRGCGRQRTFSMGNYFPHDIIIFPLGYKIKTIFSQLPFFVALNLLLTCVWSRVIIFLPKKHSFGNGFA